MKPAKLCDCFDPVFCGYYGCSRRAARLTQQQETLRQLRQAAAKADMQAFFAKAAVERGIALTPYPEVRS